MAGLKSQAWLIQVTNESITAALVLAQSIRKTQTSRSIVAICSENLDSKKLIMLSKFFNMVFYMNAKHSPNENENVLATVFAFSLCCFEKCVYIASNSLMLESSENLFADVADFRCVANSKGRELSLVFLRPNMDLSLKLQESVAKRYISDNDLIALIAKIKGESYITEMESGIHAQFILDKGKLLNSTFQTSIIEFTTATKNETIKFPEAIMLIEKEGLALYEQLIIKTWMDIYLDGNIVKMLENSTTVLETESASTFSYKNEPVAIIGMSCRYPGAKGLEEFWNLLFTGQEGISKPPIFRWTKKHSPRSDPRTKNSQAGFLVDPVDGFDAPFFGVSANAALYLDPQARLLHEVLWESLEDAGINPLTLYGSHTGVYTGSWMNDYQNILKHSVDKNFFKAYLGNSPCATAARLSLLLGLTGPSIATQSGCSSAILALDLAVKSLRAGETNLALVGGVNLLLRPFTSNMMEYVIAPDGRCKTFDAKADGYGRAEGCGVLVLKRLSDALHDRDKIWALVRGSAVAQEGLSRSLGTPTVHCEALAMKLAMVDAGVTPEQVSFVEAHGTGTQVGDPMEVAAIAKAYCSPLRKTPLVIGSVKTNVGHTEACSGITGIMKAVLALQYELIPKQLNFETLNPEISLDCIPAIIPTENLPWPKKQDEPRLCGVNSFGITGTDGHVIIQEAPDYKLPKFHLGLERPIHIMTISGKSKEAIEELLAEYGNRFSELTEKENNSFANVAYSANVGRASFAHRSFLVARNYVEAANILKEEKFLQAEVKAENSLKLCFLFTGQGSQYPGMAKLLYETSPVFRVTFDRCDKELREKYDISISPVLWKSRTDSKSELSRTIYSQTSIFCVEYCLLKLWESWGIKPDYVLGHSLGEFCAAVAAGVLDFEDALKLVAKRSQLIDSLCQGSMLVIKASQPEVEKWMKVAKIDLDFAAVNNPEQTVVAGDTKTVEALLAYLNGQGTKAIILEATHAFHSRHMDPMLESYRKVAQSIRYKPKYPNVQYISGMTGRVIEDSSQLGPDYWVAHTREKVSFIEACSTLREKSCQNYLEVGPQPILGSFVLLNNESSLVNCYPSIRKGVNDWDTLLTSLGKLYLLGYIVNWKGYDQPYIRKKVSLPFHPFHRKSFWVDCTSNSNKSPKIHPLLGSQFGNASALTIFQNKVTLKSIPYLKDHIVGSRVLFPGAGFTEMCIAAGYCAANRLTESLDQSKRAIIHLENLLVEAPLELNQDKVCHFQVIVNLLEETASFQVKAFHQNSHSAEEKWVLQSSANFFPVASTKHCLNHWNPNRIPEIISSSEATTTETFYKSLDKVGLKYGENFRMLRKIWANGQEDCTEIVAEMELPSDWSKYLLHPVVIDAVFQISILTEYPNLAEQLDRLKVLVGIGSLTLFTGVATSTNKIYLHAIKKNEKTVVFICTENWAPVAFVENVELVDTTVNTIESVLEQQNSPVPDTWEETWRPISDPFNNQVTRKENPGKAFSSKNFIEKAQAIANVSPEEREIFEKNKRLVVLYILNALKELGWDPKVGEHLEVDSLCNLLKIQPKFQKLVRFYFSIFEEDAKLLQFLGKEKWTLVTGLPENTTIIQEITKLTKGLKSIPAFAKVTAIHEHFGKNLSKILLGQQSALDLLFPKEENEHKYSAEAYYQSHPYRKQVTHLSKLILSSAFSKANYLNENEAIYKVLEVGSGTGSMSEHLLKHLRANWGTQFEFWYTDISQFYFGKAEIRFEEFKQNVKFEVFNIEQSPLSQDIPLGYFDLVCASDVVHATRDLEETLVYLRQTLRPGGTICLSETVVPSRDVTLVFGLLDGFWRFEDFDRRPYHCCVQVEVWNKVLSKCGFREIFGFKAGVDQFAYLTAVADPEVKVDTLMASRLLREDIHKGLPTWVIFSDGGSIKLGVGLANMLVVSGNKVVLAVRRGEGTTGLREGVTFEEIEYSEVDATDFEKVLTAKEGVEGVIYSWGMNLNKTEVNNVALPFLHIVNTLVDQRKPPRLYVVTQGVNVLTEDTGTSLSPTIATLTGMVKSLKNQCFDMFVRMVDLEVGTSVEEQLAQLLYELALNKGSREKHRLMVAYRGNVRYEPRLGKSLIKKDDNLKLPSSSQRYHLKLPMSRMIQDLEFEPLSEVESIEDNEIEVKVKAFSLNFKDILTILKPSEEFESWNAVGLDFAGVVTKVGKLANLKVGQRVFGCYPKEDQMPSHLVVDWEFVAKIPDQMTNWEAATPPVFITAYYCLITVAKMKKGDKVLIHTGTGGVGLAAIQLANLVGAEIITTAGNPRKRAYLRGLGIQHVFHSRDTSFEQNILKVTSGQGVDIVLNSITGPGLKEASLRATAKKGRFVEMSKLGNWTSEEVKAIRPDVDYSIVDMSKLDKCTKIDLIRLMKSFLLNGQFNAVPFVKFDALRIRQALQYFQNARHIGRVVITMPEVRIIEGRYKTEVPLFSPQSTYLITGGLGGIGFAVCKWMLGLGAKDVVLMGRRAPANEILEQIKGLQKNGYNICVKLADIGNLQQCQTLIEEIGRTMKPLRGVMHCAGVLRDNLYPHQTWESFQAVFNAKVQGTWNLHEMTKTLPLEHFVVFSSIAALLGPPGQSNHAAANCFEDKFIHYRHGLGLPGLSINWGQWAEVGVAKNISMTVLPVSAKRMLNGLQMAMRTEKQQLCFCDFASINNMSAMIPISNYYLDEWMLKKYANSKVYSNLDLKTERFWQDVEYAGNKADKVFSYYLKEILRNALRMDADEKLSETGDLQILGVDSLMTIELKNAIQGLLGNRLSVTTNMLKGCNTIQSISEAVVGAILEQNLLKNM